MNEYVKIYKNFHIRMNEMYDCDMNELYEVGGWGYGVRNGRRVVDTTKNEKHTTGMQYNNIHLR